MLASACYKGDDWQDKESRSPLIAELKTGRNGKSPSLGGKPVCWMTKKEVLLQPKCVSHILNVDL